MNVTTGDSRVLAINSHNKDRKLEQFVSEIRVTGFEWLKKISKSLTFHNTLTYAKKNLKASWKPTSKIIRNNRLYTNFKRLLYYYSQAIRSSVPVANELMNSLTEE